MARLSWGAHEQVILDGAEGGMLKQASLASERAGSPFSEMVKFVDFARLVAGDPALDRASWANAVTMMVRACEDTKALISERTDLPKGLSIEQLAPALPNPAWTAPRPHPVNAGSTEYSVKSRYKFFPGTTLIDLASSEKELRRYPNGLKDVAIVACIRPKTLSDVQPYANPYYGYSATRYRY